MNGEISDTVIDLRRGSPIYGEHFTTTLSSSRANALYFPRGLAHGICVLREYARVVYKVSSVHAPSHDGGIRWNSAGIPWLDDAPIVSERDQRRQSLSEYQPAFALE